MVLYRLLISVFALWQTLRLVLRGDRASLRDRLGFTGPAQTTPHLWLHAASNGELASARPVIEALRAARPDLALLITCNSPSGVALARDWGHTARLAPFDLGWIAKRMFRRWQVVAHITMEAEVWPNRLRHCPGPVIVLGGRMSEGTARGWRWFGSTPRQVLGHVAFLSAQDDASATRFLELGLPQMACGPAVNLKALYDPPKDQTPDAALRAAYPRAQTWLAASTHEGEEAVVIAAHQEARKTRPDLRLILAPRHPRRAAQVQALLTAAGLDHALRSESGTAEVLLADTLGEMARWYALAGTVFIGGTLGAWRGHTPYEPAAFGQAILHGPDMANFTEAVARLHRAKAAREVRDSATLAQALGELADAEVQAAKGQAAQAALKQDTDLAGLMARVLPLLPPA